MNKITPLEAQKWIITFPATTTTDSTRTINNFAAKLVCFPWAGGNGQSFRPWNKFLSSEKIQLSSIMLPGRLSRSSEKIMTNIPEIVECLYQCLKILNFLGENEPPLIFFGHSYGGIIAYELSRLLLHRDEYLLPHLIISSTNNPHLLSTRSLNLNEKKFHLLSNERLLEEVINHGGLPSGVHIDILRHMLPVIRGDYQGLETYIQSSFSSERIDNEEDILDGIPTPSLLSSYPGYMTVLGSENDPGDVTQESLMNWRYQCQTSENKFSLYFFPSETHFYFLESSNSTQFFEKLCEICLNPFHQGYENNE